MHAPCCSSVTLHGFSVMNSHLRALVRTCCRWAFSHRDWRLHLAASPFLPSIHTDYSGSDSDVEQFTPTSPAVCGWRLISFSPFMLEPRLSSLSLKEALTCGHPRNSRHTWLAVRPDETFRSRFAGLNGVINCVAQMALTYHYIYGLIFEA